MNSAKHGQDRRPDSSKDKLEELSSSIDSFLHIVRMRDYSAEALDSLVSKTQRVLATLLRVEYDEKDNHEGESGAAAAESAASAGPVLKPLSVKRRRSILSVVQSRLYRRRKDATALFLDYDFNKDGYIDLDELCACLKASGVTFDRAELAAATQINGVEQEWPGHLSFREFMAIAHGTSTDRMDRETQKRQTCVGRQTVRNCEESATIDDETAQLIEAIGRQLVERRGSRLHDIFAVYDRNGDESISFDEFKFAMAALGLRSLGADTLHRFMDEFDSNGDGKLQYTEFCGLLQYISKNRRGVRQPGPQPSPASPQPVPVPAAGAAQAAGERRFRQQLQASGVPSLGELSAEDLQTLCAMSDEVYSRPSKLGGLRKVFNRLDVSGSKTLSQDEFDRGLQRMGVHLRGGQLRRIVGHFDDNGNGEIDYHEFVKMLAAAKR